MRSRSIEPLRRTHRRPPSRGCSLAIPRAGLLILELIPGEPLARQRYPESPIDDHAFARLLNALTALHRWTPWAAPDREAIIREVEQRLAKHADRQLILPSEVGKAIRLIRATGWDPELHHRDMLFANCLVDGDRVALIDWEYAGFAVPGYHEALLWTLLTDDPARRDWLGERIRNSGEERTVLFDVNLPIVIAREMHILREPDDAALQQRATLLTTELERLRSWLTSRPG